MVIGGYPKRNETGDKGWLWVALGLLPPDDTIAGRSVQFSSSRNTGASDNLGRRNGGSSKQQSKEMTFRNYYPLRVESSAAAPAAGLSSC